MFQVTVGSAWFVWGNGISQDDAFAPFIDDILKYLFQVFHSFTCYLQSYFDIPIDGATKTLDYKKRKGGGGFRVNIWDGRKRVPNASYRSAYVVCCKGTSNTMYLNLGQSTVDSSARLDSFIAS